MHSGRAGTVMIAVATSADDGSETRSFCMSQIRNKYYLIIEKASTERLVIGVCERHACEQFDPRATQVHGQTHQGVC